MGMTFKVSNLDDMCRLMCDNDYKGLESTMDNIGKETSEVKKPVESVRVNDIPPKKKRGRKSKVDKAAEALEAQRELTQEEREAIEKEREEYIARISALETTLEKFDKCNDVEAFVVGGVFFDKNDIATVREALSKMIAFWNLCAR